MRIFMKAVASTATVGLLALGAVAGSGGSAFAGPIPTPTPNPYTLITGCSTAVNNVRAGFEPNCTAFGGTINDPNTSIFIGILWSEGALATLIDDQDGQGLESTWDLVCLVDGVNVSTPGSYEITSTDQDPYTEIDLQTAVGSPAPNQCAVDNLTVQTVLPLDEGDLDDAVPFQIGVGAEAAIAVPGAVHQRNGTTGQGAHADLCADDTANGNAGAKIQGFVCLSDLADFFVQTNAGQLVHNGDCVSVTKGGYVFLARCVADDAVQKWTQSKAGGTVENDTTGTCLTAPSVKNGIQLIVKACGHAANQQWEIPAAAVLPSAPSPSALAAALHLK
jgi:hypothetical protein